MSHSDPNDASENKVLHEVDGIEEYDNELPGWWLNALYATVVFGVVYWFVYHTAGLANLPRAAYEAEMDKAAASQAAATALTGPVTAEALATLAKDRGTVARGKQVFATTCVACHRADGGGIVGPNLTDEFWLHGGAPDKIYVTIKDGVPAKGMPAWGPQLGPERVQAVTAYVITLRGTNVSGGKAPQGEREALSLR